MTDLCALPEEAWERQLALPVLVAFRIEIPQDLLEAEEMNSVQKLKSVYAEWERRVKDEAAQEVALQYAERERAVLRELLGERFGPLPAEASERIENAGVEELERWIRRVVRAPSLADVLAP